MARFPTSEEVRRIDRLSKADTLAKCNEALLSERRVVTILESPPSVPLSKTKTAELNRTLKWNRKVVADLESMIAAIEAEPDDAVFAVPHISAIATGTGWPRRVS